jgi:2-methylisocitrate lyase-like PEP mutase family enzyme
MINRDIQKEKADQFRQLHYSEKMLLLPNVWDALGAILLESLDYPAIATASAAVAWANGYNDGENIPFDDLLEILKKIASKVNIPVTADIESGYADNDIQLQENIKRLIEAGIVGINIEDTDKKNKTINTIEVQCNKIRLIKKVAGEMGIPFFINARTDVLLHGDQFSTGSQFEEIVKRGLAYKEAGADCFFPIALKQKEDIEQLVTLLKMPINIITIPGVPDLRVLEKAGVARVSLGPSFLKIAIKAMKNIAVQLQKYDGLSAITENEITSDYLKELINKTNN